MLKAASQKWYYEKARGHVDTTAKFLQRLPTSAQVAVLSPAASAGSAGLTVRRYLPWPAQAAFLSVAGTETGRATRGTPSARAPREQHAPAQGDSDPRSASSSTGRVIALRCANLAFSVGS